MLRSVRYIIILVSDRSASRVGYSRLWDVAVELIHSGRHWQQDNRRTPSLSQLFTSF